MVHVPDEADKRPLAESMSDLEQADPFRDTWDAYRKPVIIFDRVNTDMYRTGWPKPTIYREHEAIHILANVVDQLLDLRNHTRATPPECDCGLAQRPRGSHHLTGCALIEWDRSFPPLFGGWTPTYEGDMCGGGHPGGHYSLNGRPACPRCGRYLDLRRCLCGEESHRRGLSRSFCPNRMRFDKRDAEDHAYLFQDGPHA